VRRALRELRRLRKVPPLAIVLRKRIPSQAGLGGGSSDAAGLLHAADRRFDLGLTLPDMETTLARVGSDTAFFAAAAPALCTGRGEHVYPLARLRKLHLLLWWPGVGASTPDVFSRFNSSLTAPPPCVIDFLNIAASGDVERIGRALFNRLETASQAARPRLSRAVRTFRSLPFAGVCMTGSGSCMYGITGSRAEAHGLATRHASRLPGVLVAVDTVEAGRLSWRSRKSASS